MLHYAGIRNTSTRGLRYALFGICSIYALVYAAGFAFSFSVPLPIEPPSSQAFNHPFHVATALWITDSAWVNLGGHFIAALLGAIALSLGSPRHRRTMLRTYIIGAVFLLLAQAATFEVLVLVSPLQVTAYGVGGTFRVYEWSVSEYFAYLISFGHVLIVGLAFFAGVLTRPDDRPHAEAFAHGSHATCANPPPDRCDTASDTRSRL